MTRISGSRRSGPGGLAYFIRRSGDEYDVIELQPGDREVVIASSLAPGEGPVLQKSLLEDDPEDLEA